MENKEENVYEEVYKTSQTAEAEEEKGGTVLGKFKDVNALAEAYSALQAEFTRRSQRLRALEKEAENLAEKKGTDAEEFSSVVPQEKEAIEPSFTQAVKPAEPTKIQEQVLVLEGDRLYEAVKNSEEVRLKVIGDYLASLSFGGAPVAKGGARSPGVSVAKARTIEEAGKMALELFRQ